jgi:hypothetical protein
LVMPTAALVIAFTMPTRGPAVWIVNEEPLSAVTVPVAAPLATMWDELAVAVEGRASAKSAPQVARRRVTKNPFRRTVPPPMTFGRGESHAKLRRGRSNECPPAGKDG